MTTFPGHSIVESGYYLSFRSFLVEVVGHEGGTLPGPSSVTWVGVPFLAALLIAPVLGLAFLVSVPALGLAQLGRAWFSNRNLRESLRLPPASAAR
jgi:hypothetical protein